MTMNFANSGPAWLLRGIGLLIVAVLVVILLTLSAHVFLLVFAGILLAVFLRALSDWLGRFSGLSSGWALAVVIGLLAVMVALGGWYLASPVADQFDDLAKRLPQSMKQVKQSMQQYSWGRLILHHTGEFRNWVPTKSNMLSGAAGVFSTTLGFLVDVVVVLFVGFYLAVQPDLYKNGFLRLVPHAGRIRTSEVLDEIALTLRWWLLGRTCAMVAIAVTTALGLWLLSVPLALILGILAGVLNFVPNIGPLISAVPALLLSLTQSPVLAAYVAALYVGIQFVESYLVTPLVQQQTVSTPPALAITAQVFMGVLFGGLGLLLATPLTAALLVAVHRLYVEDVLESPTIVRPTSTENASGITFHEARPKTASAESASVAKPR